ncbi:unnamed protein product [Schistosoma rodhaini]|nr:hypothetical protein Smp_158650 [Schistosoma mansoni]CAH8621238.1 unnamed protein product [Schistosoma rodhaini]|eukprot:XP_018646562.1 hypothetical protein Smp_158650 [Schistosoma mansoni]
MGSDLLCSSIKCHRLLKRLVHVGKRKLEKFERHSPGKLLNRHLLCKALSTWKAMRSLQNPHNCWSLIEPSCSISSQWDEDCEFISVCDLTVSDPSYCDLLSNTSVDSVDKDVISSDHDYASPILVIGSNL